MKKTLSILLSVIFIISLITVPAIASDVEVVITGTKTGNEATFIVFATNVGLKSEGLNVYVAFYDKAGIVQKAESYTLSVAPDSTAQGKYTADISQYTAKIYVWEDGLRPVSPALTSDECGEVIKIPYTSSDAFASYAPESANPASNVADGNIDTRWTVSGSSADNPENVTIYLGDDYILSRVGIGFGYGSEREYNYSVSASEDGETFTTVAETATSIKTDDIQYVDLPPVRARYIRVNVYGRVDGGDWVQITEVETYGCKDTQGAYLMESMDDWSVSAMDEMTYTDYRPSLGEKLYVEETGEGLVLYDDVDRSDSAANEKLAVREVTASQTPESNNHQENTLDGNADTIWTAKNVTDAAPAYLVSDLGDSYYLTGVGIGFDLGNERTYSFSVAVSSDNRNYTTVVPRRTSGATEEVQYFPFEQTEARYVKYTFYQRTDASNNGWVRISEIEAYGGEEPADGAGGVLVQKTLTLPADRGDYEISFDLEATGNVFYSGVSITDGIITGGADLDNYAALQLRFDNDGDDKIRINYMTSNYFNEGSPVALFENSFNKGEKIHFEILVSPLDRSVYITASDSNVTETQHVYFSYADSELTRNTTWTWLEANTLVFNTGAGAKSELAVSDFALRQVERENNASQSSDAVNGIVRLEAVRLESYPTSSGDYYGRYIYHNGTDSMLYVAADKNPAVTRFVERKGLIGTGVSFEAVTNPGYFAVREGEDIYLRKLENTGDFYARATFVKESCENVGYYTGNTYSYRTYLPVNNTDKYMYDTDNNHKSGKLGAWSKWSEAQSSFYLKSEASEYVADNFYGSSISSQWWTNYPWKSNNPTNSSYNHSGLITKNNVIVENGELFLRATKISGWPTNIDGDTGIQYNKWGKTWERWKGYVGVVSIQNKVFNKNCYIEGSFKQPESPIGYWNAFWLTGRDSWPPEIDIFETLSSSYGAYAWHTAIHGENDTNNLFGKQSSNINITTGYHTFAMDWGYDYIKFYVDGKMFQRAHNNATLNFQKNLRLILNTGLGGWEAEPDDTMVWDDGMRCRYIRSFMY